ncbi:MAG: hypothetical protein AB2693_31350, partial [Candidatus Thiodiazotropha sp.]
QFGDYKGQPFKWMPEHCLGYSAWLIDGMKGETLFIALAENDSLGFGHSPNKVTVKYQATNHRCTLLGHYFT